MRERTFAVEKIMKIRGREALGKTKPRARKLPKLNKQAKTLQTLISWDKTIEPLFTCHLTKEEIKSFQLDPMKVPYYCGHTQPIERAIKEVSLSVVATSTVTILILSGHCCLCSCVWRGEEGWVDQVQGGQQGVDA